MRKKIALIGVVVMVVAELTNPAFLFVAASGRSLRATPPFQGGEKSRSKALQHSFNLAEGLQWKIEAMKKKQATPGAKVKREQVEVSEVEVESYILLVLQQKKIPAKLDAVDVQFTDAYVATDSQLTLGPNTTGSYIVDRIIRGTHKLFVKGKFAGRMGRAKFELESVRVDRIPVPVFLAQLVFNKLVKPMLPQADIREPFQLPFGIESVAIVPGKAVVVY